ncbi:cobalamin biosynthesis protein CobQ [Adonisia turfae]|uniref:Cobalamin biosynthesis protein CobQ n=1 Tax=Adonisia turfae CCMR0081 TaxID=2292702 RepID=A0A6M0RJJ6_9CYAN|nr:cobalamin biosynthesis protein CobQ [Adonisia turfae]NEZ55831.1 cobalamin biosynthesis protein CobQ [Adonisia turfae CCMR0081]
MSSSTKKPAGSKSAEKPRIHLVSGDKGGTGKSVVSAMLVDYCRSKQQVIQPIDGDMTNPTLSGAYPDAIEMVVSDDRDMRSQLNTIFVSAQKEGKTVIVDLPARSESALTAWFSEYNVLSLAEAQGIKFIKWWVTDGDPSTLDLFSKSVKGFPEIRHIFVKNMGLTKPVHWTVLESWPEIGQWQQDGIIEMIEFPWMDKLLISRVRRAQQTFGELADAAATDDILTQGRIQGFLRQGFMALEQTSVFSQEPDKILARKSVASASEKEAVSK